MGAAFGEHNDREAVAVEEDEKMALRSMAGEKPSDTVTCEGEISKSEYKVEKHIHCRCGQSADLCHVQLAVIDLRRSLIGENLKEERSRRKRVSVFARL